MLYNLTSLSTQPHQLSRSLVGHGQVEQTNKSTGPTPSSSKRKLDRKRERRAQELQRQELKTVLPASFAV